MRPDTDAARQTDWGEGEQTIMKVLEQPNPSVAVAMINLSIWL